VTVLTDGAGQAVASLGSASAGTTTVTAETEGGIKDTLEVRFYEPVEIEAIDANAPVEVGDAMAFTATVVGTGPFTYTWVFGGAGDVSGDGTPNPTYVYDEPGTYDVTLTVDSPYDSDTLSRQVEVMRRQPASMTLGASPIVQAVGETIDFVARLFDKLGSPLGADYAVTFSVSPLGQPGGGQTQTVPTDGSGQAEAMFTSTEPMSATVVAETENGVAETVEVLFYDPVEIGKLTSNSPVRVGRSLLLSSDVTGSGPLTYGWEFEGDPTVFDVTTPTPSALYGDPGTYAITLTVSSPYDSETVSHQVTIEPHRVFLPLINR
jgi:PKD repeat protein